MTLSFLQDLKGGSPSTAAPAAAYGPPVHQASAVPIYGSGASTPANPPASSYGPPANPPASSYGPPASTSKPANPPASSYGPPPSTSKPANPPASSYGPPPSSSAGPPADAYGPPVADAYGPPYSNTPADSGYLAVQSPYANMAMMHDAGYGTYGGGVAPYVAMAPAPAASSDMSMAGAMTFGTIMMFLMALLGQHMGMMGGDKRKKRQVGLGSMFTEESSLFYKILSDLDQEDCIASAICSASAYDIARNERNQKLLSSLGIEKGVPVSWNEMNDVKSKFQYAAFIGDHLRDPHLENGCKVAFPKCNIEAEEILNLLTNEIKSCDSMMNSLERLWPDGFENEKALKKRSSTVKKAHEGRKLTILGNRPQF